MNEIIEFITRQFKKIPDLFNQFTKIIFNISKYFTKLIDFIINNEKFYRLNILIVFIIFFIIIYFLLNYISNLDIIKSIPLLSNLRERKYFQVILLLLFSILVSIFYFFVHRNEFRPESIYKDKKSLIKNEDNSFNNDNFKNTIKYPIFRLLKSFLGTIFLIVIPVVLIVGFFWLFNYQQMYNITQILLGLALVITTLSIIAYLFKIDTNECKNKGLLGKLGCLIKNIIFFIF